VTDLPLVSIVTPTYNQARFLEETILSVLGQDYPRIEHIVIDGGSVDGTLDVIREYAGRLAFWTSERDQGQADAINKGFRMIRGDVFAYINSDDTYVPGAVSRAVRWFAEHPDVEMICGDANLIDEEGRVLDVLRGRGFDYRAFVCQKAGFINQPSTFMRRSVLAKAGFLNPSLYYNLDFEYWLRVGRVCRIEYVPAVFSNFRIHPASKTMRSKSVIAEEFVKVYEEFLREYGDDASIRDIREEALAGAYATAGEMAYGGLLPGEARKYLRESFRRNPRNVFNAELVFKYVTSLGGRRAIRLSREVYERLTGRVLF
jgi:glycosyltransferase involved in cell wall biosynthesis